MNHAETAIAVLSTRGGFDDWWDNIDPDIQEEIMQALQTALGQVTEEVEVLVVPKSAMPPTKKIKLEHVYMQIHFMAGAVRDMAQTLESHGASDLAPNLRPEALPELIAHMDSAYEILVELGRGVRAITKPL